MLIENSRAPGAGWAAVVLCSLFVAVAPLYLLFFLFGWGWRGAVAGLHEIKSNSATCATTSGDQHNFLNFN